MMTYEFNKFTGFIITLFIIKKIFQTIANKNSSLSNKTIDNGQLNPKNIHVE